jgi:hypothetical protein
MSNSYGDKSVATMRTLVAVIDRELAGATAAGELRVAWDRLVEILALGAAPELRECPSCHNTGMRAASRCMYCWSSLAPLPPLPPADAHRGV